jgi:hypothetical protein
MHVGLSIYVDKGVNVSCIDVIDEHMTQIVN